MILPNSMCALLHIAIFAGFASAATKLAFTSPGFSQKGPASLPYFSLGQKVKISWTTPFDNTTLILYQKRDGQEFPKVLAGMPLPHKCPIDVMQY